MLRQALALLFQIHDVTPLKLFWVALTLLNIVLMLTLAWRSAWAFRVYLIATAIAGLIQASPLWGEWGELAIALAAASWLVSELPEERYGKVFALALGIVMAAALMFAVPPPWPMYSRLRFFSRLYSSAAFGGVALGTAILPWTLGNGINWRLAIGVLWFATVVGAGVPLDVSYWGMAVVTKLLWTGCLIAWLTLCPFPDRLSVARKTAIGVHR